MLPLLLLSAVRCGYLILMLIALVQLCGGFILLVWAADRLVLGASAAARNLGISPLIIGLTVIALGTSAPELIVSAVAAWQGQPGLAVGNAIGSNIANIGLILGITALLYPLRVESGILKHEFPQLMLIMLVSLLMAVDLQYSRAEGWILLTSLALLIAWMVRLGLRKAPEDPLAREFAAEIPADIPTRIALVWLPAIRWDSAAIVHPLPGHGLAHGNARPRSSRQLIHRHPPAFVVFGHADR